MAARRSKSRRPWGVFLGYAVLGALLGLGQAPFHLYPLMFAVIPFVAHLFTAQATPKAGLLRGWAFGIGYFATVLHWIVEPFLVEPEIYGWMAPFALSLMAGGLALFWGVAVWLTVRLAPDRLGRIVLLAVAMTVMEFARSNVLTGFPWGLLAYAWMPTPVAQFAAYLGPHGLGLFTWLILSAPALAAPRIWHGSVVSLAVFVAAYGLGEWRLSTITDLHPRGTIVRLIQPNAPQEEKWDPAKMPIFFQRQLGYTGANTEPVPDVALWPETSLPFYLGEDGARLALVSDAAGDATNVIAGGLRRDEQDYFNSLAHIDKRGGIITVFDKHHLVPFGEYLPFAELMSSLGLRALANNFGGFASGDGPRVINSLDLPPYQPLICYEAIFPQYSKSAGGRADWLIHITNDAWFGGFSGPYQHLAQSQMRAIEQGLPLARSANTGISAMIDAGGQIVDAIPLNQSNFLDIALPAPIPPTLYARTGEVLWLILAVLFAGASVVRQRHS